MIENSYNIWIPSLQRFVRFREIQSQHHLFLYKASVISEHELLFAFSQLIQELCTENIDTKKFTILDKYIVFVYLRMICVGTIINYKFTCPKCKESGSDKIDLNAFISPFKSILDQKYDRTIKVPGIDFDCHLPTIEKELKTSIWIQENDIIITDIEQIPTNNALNVMNHINEIKIDGKETHFYALPISQQITVIKNVPTFYISEISNKFIFPILAKLSNSDVLTSQCKTKSCNHIIKIPLESINEILRFILVDAPDEYFSNILQFSEHYNMNPEYICKKSVAELNMMKTHLSNNKKSSTNDNNVDNFEGSL